MTLSNNLRKRIEIEERWHIRKEIQGSLEKLGIIPTMPVLLSRIYGSYLEMGAELLLGGMIGVFSLIINFIIFVFLLHIEF